MQEYEIGGMVAHRILSPFDALERLTLPANVLQKKSYQLGVARMVAEIPAVEELQELATFAPRSVFQILIWQTVN